MTDKSAFKKFAILAVTYNMEVSICAFDVI